MVAYFPSKSLPRRLAYLLQATITLGSCVCPGAHNDPVPVATVPMVGGRGFSIDGMLEEPEWRGATRLRLKDYWNQKKHPFEPTEVLVLNSKECLLVAFIAQDNRIRSEPDRKLDGETCADDCVEVFLGGSEEIVNKGIGFEINADGVVSDMIVRSLDQLDHAWNAGPDLRVATKRVAALRRWSEITSGAGWITEIGLSWTLLRQVLVVSEGGGHGVRLRVNFARWDHAATGWGIFTIWSDPLLPEPKPHALQRYGWLYLAP